MAMAWGSSSAITSSDSTAPFGLPGRLMMIAFPRIPAAPRESTARGVFCAPAARICSGNPGIMRSTTEAVASGVTSRGPRPVPPVVRITSASLESAASFRKSSIAARSSARTAEETILHPSSRQRAITDGPEWSSDVPAATESLIVRTDTRMNSRGPRALRGLDVFRVAVALAFIHQAQGFHQQARGRAGNRGAFRSGVEINFEFTGRPAHHLKDGCLALRRTQFCVGALARGEKKLAHFTGVANREPAGFLAHFERLHQIENAH